MTVKRDIIYISIIYKILTKFLLQNEHNDTDGRIKKKRKKLFSFLKILFIYLFYFTILY